jgi:predicted ester cyclase
MRASLLRPLLSHLHSTLRRSSEKPVGRDEAYAWLMRTVERLMRLWTEPVPAGPAAIEAFAELYTDPVSINGVDVRLGDVVERARSLQRAFADLSIEIIDEVEAPDRLVIVFWQRGRHVGPLALPFGEVAPTGRRVQVRTIDVLSISVGRISAIQVVPDNLGLAMQLGVVPSIERA